MSAIAFRVYLASNLLVTTTVRREALLEKFPRSASHRLWAIFCWPDQCFSHTQSRLFWKNTNLKRWQCTYSFIRTLYHFYLPPHSGVMMAARAAQQSFTLPMRALLFPCHVCWPSDERARNEGAVKMMLTSQHDEIQSKPLPWYMPSEWRNRRASGTQSTNGILKGERCWCPT